MRKAKPVLYYAGIRRAGALDRSPIANTSSLSFHIPFSLWSAYSSLNNNTVLQNVRFDLHSPRSAHLALLSSSIAPFSAVNISSGSSPMVVHAFTLPLIVAASPLVGAEAVKLEHYTMLSFYHKCFLALCNVSFSIRDIRFLGRSSDHRLPASPRF